MSAFSVPKQTYMESLGTLPYCLMRDVGASSSKGRAFPGVPFPAEGTPGRALMPPASLGAALVGLAQFLLTYYLYELRAPGPPAPLEFAEVVDQCPALCPGPSLEFCLEPVVERAADLAAAVVGLAGVPLPAAGAAFLILLAGICGFAAGRASAPALPAVRRPDAAWSRRRAVAA